MRLPRVTSIHRGARAARSMPQETEFCTRFVATCEMKKPIPAKKQPARVEASYLSSSKKSRTAIGFQINFPYMSLIALVAKAPSVAQIVTVTGPEMSWWVTDARRVLAKRVQSDCRMQAPVHAPATADMARSIWNERVAAESFILGATRGAPPFDAIAHMNRENTVHVVVTRDYSYESSSACDLLLRVSLCPLDRPTTASTGWRRDGCTNTIGVKMHM
jgi:hypothetical protein